MCFKINVPARLVEAIFLDLIFFFSMTNKGCPLCMNIKILICHLLLCFKNLPLNCGGSFLVRCS